LPPPPNPEAAKTQADVQANQQKAQLEQLKAQADVQRETAQAQSEIAIAERKAQLETQMALLNAEIKREQHAMDMQAHAAKMQAHEAKLNEPRATVTVNHDAPELTGPLGVALNQLGQHLATQQAGHTQAVLDALAAHARPKRIRKTGNGEYVTEAVQ
jgi:small-conductance mechanosensitive channel